MKLVFEADTAEELQNHILRFAEVFGLKAEPSPTQPPPITEMSYSSQQPKEEDLPLTITKPSITPNVVSDPQPPAPPKKRKGGPGRKSIYKTTPAPTANQEDWEMVPAEAIAPGGVSTTIEEVGDGELDLQPTKEEVYKALSKLCEEKGEPLARELLAKFKCVRISELKPEDYRAFVDTVRNILA